MGSIFRECCICEGCYKILVTDEKLQNDLRHHRYGVCDDCGSKKQDWFSVKCNYKKLALFGVRWNMELLTLRIKYKDLPDKDKLNELIEKAKERYLTSNQLNK